MRLKHEFYLLLPALITIGGCSSSEVKVTTMAYIMGLIALAFYMLAVPSVLIGKLMSINANIFNKYVQIAISFFVFIGLNALLSLLDPDIAAILFFLVLMCVLGLNLGYFLKRMRTAMLLLLAFSGGAVLFCLFDIYRLNGFFVFLVNTYRSFR